MNIIVVFLYENKIVIFNAIIKARKTYLFRDIRDILLNGYKRLIKRLKDYIKYNKEQLQSIKIDIRDSNKEDYDIAKVTASDIVLIDKNFLLNKRRLV